MNAKPNVPEEIWVGGKDYSWRSDLKVNGWLFVATIISGLADVIFSEIVSQWAPPLRAGIVVAEFAAIGLWIRSLSAWIRGMDEMHARITRSAVLFAVSATFFVVLLWHRLNAAGIFANSFLERYDATVGHCFLLLTIFYFIGQACANRRFK